MKFEGKSPKFPIHWNNIAIFGWLNVYTLNIYINVFNIWRFIYIVSISSIFVDEIFFHSNEDYNQSKVFKVDKPNTMQTSNLNILGPTLQGAHIFQRCALVSW